MLTADDPIWVEVNELAASAASRVHRRFWKWLAFDDCKQAANEWAWRRRDRVEEFLMRDNVEERKRGEYALITAMSRAAERAARKAKAEASGYQVEDEYFYTEQLVETLLKAWDAGDAQLAGQILDPAEMGGRKTRQPSEGGNLQAMLIDIDRAWKHLDSRTQGILRLRYIDEVTSEKVAERWEISRQRVDQIARRGLRNLVDALGGESPGF